MKIEFNQKEEDGVYTVSLKGVTNGVEFANKHILVPPCQITKESINYAISNCIQDFINRYDIEMGRINQS